MSEGAETRRRARHRVSLVAGLAVFAVVMSVATYGCGYGHPSTVGERRHPRPATATAAYPVPSDAGVPTNRGSQGFCPGPDNSPPNGGLSRRELCNATIDLPWPINICHAGPHTFTDGASWEGSNAITFGPEWGPSPLPIAYADVDHDGYAETLTTVECNGYGDFVLVLGLTAAGDITIFPSPISVGALRVEGTPQGYVQLFNPGFGSPGDQGGWRTFRWTWTGWAEVTGVPQPPPLSTAPVVVPPSSAGPSR